MTVLTHHINKRAGKTIYVFCLKDEPKKIFVIYC